MDTFLRNNILIALLILPMFGWGQNRKSEFKRFSIGLHFDGLYGHRKLNFASGNQSIGRSRNASEIPKTGFGMGLDFSQRLNEKLSIEYGIDYSSFGYKTKYSPIEFDFSVADAPIKSKQTFTHHTLGIPVKFNYGIKIGRLNTYASAGISLFYIINRTATMSIQYPNGETVNNSDNATLGFQALNFSWQVGFGVEYPMLERMTVKFEPFFRKSISSLYTDLNAQERPYAFGIGIRVLYNFPK